MHTLSETEYKKLAFLESKYFRRKQYNIIMVSRITGLMNRLEDKHGKMFHELYADLYSNIKESLDSYNNHLNEISYLISKRELDHGIKLVNSTNHVNRLQTIIKALDRLI